MEALTRVLISLIAETKVSIETAMADRDMSGRDGGSSPGRQPAGAKQISAAAAGREKKESAERKRLTSFTLRSLIRALSEDDSWQTKQAKRKWEKEDIVNNNPSFDPIFMKV